MNKRLFALALAASSCAGIPLAKDTLTDPGALLFNGYVRATVDCYVCHNGDGTGARGPSLAREVRETSAEKLAALIRKGPGPMPAYGPDVLSDDELGQLVSWLKTTFPAR